MLRALKEMGIKTRWTISASAFVRATSNGFPIDVLKIDKSFTRDIDRIRYSIVTPFAVLARSLNLSVWPKASNRSSNSISCARESATGQGYFFSRP